MRNLLLAFLLSDLCTARNRAGAAPRLAAPGARDSLPGVEGRIDHLTADVAGQRVFVAALGNGTVEIVDLAQGKRSGEIKGLKDPQGLAYAPSNGAVYVAGGGDGTVRSFDSHTLKPLKEIKLGRPTRTTCASTLPAPVAGRLRKRRHRRARARPLAESQLRAARAS